MVRFSWRKITQNCFWMTDGNLITFHLLGICQQHVLYYIFRTFCSIVLCENGTLFVRLYDCNSCHDLKLQFQNPINNHAIVQISASKFFDIFRNWFAENKWRWQKKTLARTRELKFAFWNYQFQFNRWYLLWYVENANDIPSNAYLTYFLQFDTLNQKNMPIFCCCCAIFVGQSWWIRCQ